MGSRTKFRPALNSDNSQENMRAIFQLALNSEAVYEILTWEIDGDFTKLPLQFIFGLLAIYFDWQSLR